MFPLFVVSSMMGNVISNYYSWNVETVTCFNIIRTWNEKERDKKNCYNDKAQPTSFAHDDDKSLWMSKNGLESYINAVKTMNFA